VGIRQLPSGTFQVRFQHHGASFAATYPTREDAEHAEPLLRAATLAGRRREIKADYDPIGGSPPPGPPPDPPPTPTPDQVRHSSTAPAQLIDTILAAVVDDNSDRAPEPDEVLTTGQVAVLLGVSRPTLVSWLEAGRIPFHWCGTHRRVRRSDVLAFREQTSRSSGGRQPSHELSPGGGWPIVVDPARRQDKLSTCG